MQKIPDGQCAAIGEVVPYLEGALSSVDALRFEAHVAECRACLGELNFQKEIVNTLKGSLEGQSMPDLPPDFSRKIAAIAEGRVTGLRDSRERRRFLAFVAVGSVMSAFIVSVQSPSVLHATGAVFFRLAAFASVALHFSLSLFQVCFRVLKSALSHALSGTPSTALILGLVFVIAAGVFLALGMRGERVAAERS